MHAVRVEIIKLYRTSLLQGEITVLTWGSVLPVSLAPLLWVALHGWRGVTKWIEYFPSKHAPYTSIETAPSSGGRSHLPLDIILKVVLLIAGFPGHNAGDILVNGNIVYWTCKLP